MEMIATVVSSDSRGLLVIDAATGQEVFVNYCCPLAFRPGERVHITYTGAMTFSIPPQISATLVVPYRATPTTPPAQTYSEIRRATILQIRRGVLIVRDPGQNNRQVTVNYPYAHHFCVGNRINIQYETAFLNGGYTINATEVFPVC